MSISSLPVKRRATPERIRPEVGKDVIVFSFLEQLDLLEGNLLGGRILRLVHPGQENLMLPKPLIDIVDCRVERRALDRWIEQTWSDLLRFE